MSVNSSDVAYDKGEFLLDLFGGCPGREQVCSSSDYDKGISEIKCLIQHFIDIGNTEEVASLRRMLQREKVAKRRAKMVENTLKGLKPA